VWSRGAAAIAATSKDIAQHQGKHPPLSFMCSFRGVRRLYVNINFSKKKKKKSKSKLLTKNMR